MIASPEKRVTQAPGLVLRNELELERPLVVASYCLQHRLVRVGNDDGPKESRISGLVERPVEHRLESDWKRFFRKPAGNRVQPRAQAAAGYHRRIEHHQEIAGTLGEGDAGRTRVSCTLTFGEGAACPKLVRVTEASKVAYGGRRRTCSAV